MTSETKAATAANLDLSGIVDGQPNDASDVTTPLSQAATAIDRARSKLSVTDNDTHIKNLNDAILVTSPLTKTVNNPGANETLTIAMSAAATVTVAQLDIDNVNATDRPFYFKTSGSTRWVFYANSVSESGSTVGSSFVIQAHNNSGVYLGRPLVIDRGDLIVQMESGLRAMGARITGDMGGVASTITLASTTIAAGARTLDGYFKVYVGTGVRYVPYYL